MNYFAFVGPALRLFQRGIGVLAEKSDANPKASAFLTVLGAGAGFFRMSPESLAAVGDALIALGSVLRNVAGAM